MRRHTLTLLWLLVAGCMPQGSGPSPRAVLVVSSRDYPLQRVVEPLESLGGTIGPKKDKSTETLDVGAKQVPQFSQYEIAYWYPQNGSDIYGVALIKWVSDLKGAWAETMRDRYFIEVYSQDEACSLCRSVKAVLSEHKVSYFSACDNPTSSTQYEKVRCGT
jgi:hypothetical protein